MSYAIRLEYPPSINTYWRRAGNRIYLSPSGKRFKNDAAIDCLAALGKVEPLTGRLGVQIELVAPNKTRDTDIDNRIKATLDALQGILFVDDSQIDRLIVLRREIAKPGHCDVIVSELTSLAHPYPPPEE
jgi:crossover junction endodeoxyribonuclease RusA